MMTSPARLLQIQHFLEQAHYTPYELAPLAGDASFRRYIRVHRGLESAMLMDAPPEKENVRPFMHVARYLVEMGYSAPKILHHDAGAGLLLLEDLGDMSFTRVLRETPSAKLSEAETELYSAAVDVLSRWQQSAAPITLPSYDTPMLMKEVQLFTDWYLPQVLGEERASALQAEYLAIWQEILTHAPLERNCFVHRDYHADNLMWLTARDGYKKVGLLDFQDGVHGDAAYDMVSLLEDARRDVPPALAQAMIQHYIAATGADAERFRRAYAVLAAQRNSKIIGIFARLAVRDGKRDYLRFLPRVWGYLQQDVRHPDLRKLRDWLDRHVEASARGEINIRRDAGRVSAGA